VVGPDGHAIKLRMIPAAAVVDPEIEIVYGAGTLIHIHTLISEMSELGIQPKRVKIDPRAGIVTPELIEQQRRDQRYEKIGSTLTGTGYAAADRCKRKLKLASEYAELRPMLNDNIIEELSELPVGEKILIEGHQGFGLSNYHGDYPYVSSRDCTAAEMLSEVGLGPSSSTKFRIILVAKAFPTRNHQGKLNDLPYAEVQQRAIVERGGGCWDIEDRGRRVGRLDLSLIKRAARANSAGEIVLTGVDYLDRSIAAAESRVTWCSELDQMIADIQRETNLDVTYLSTGPKTQSMIDLSTATSVAELVAA
jgi:adenylosuccinate synthase